MTAKELQRAFPIMRQLYDAYLAELRTELASEIDAAMTAKTPDERALWQELAELTHAELSRVLAGETIGAKYVPVDSAAVERACIKLADGVELTDEEAATIERAGL
jgi:hypothetical protein